MFARLLMHTNRRCVVADDIVIQLKDLAATLKRGEGRSTVYGAVSEIEHLRETIERLNIALWGQLKTCRCHDKAVRGE